MVTLLMCSAAMLFVMAWMLRVNANDLEAFEKELDEDLEDAF